MQKFSVNQFEELEKESYKLKISYEASSRKSQKDNIVKVMFKSLYNKVKKVTKRNKN